MRVLMVAALLAFLVGEAKTPALSAEPVPRATVLRCTFCYSGERITRDFPAAEDPYRVEAIPLGKQFTFKAVWTEGPPHIAGVSLYVYRSTKRGPRLVTEASYRPPYPVAPPGAFHGFTGLHFVYEPGMESEMTFYCGWVER